MNKIDEFFEVTINRAKKTKEAQRQTIYQAAEMLAKTMDKGGIVQLCSLDSGRAFSMEMNYRAGGLMPFHAFYSQDLALRGYMEEKDLKPELFNENESYAKKWWDIYNVDDRDMFMLISPTGCEPVIVEIAKMVKEQGRNLIAVVNGKACENTPARHSSGKKIVDYADLVLDTCCEDPDLILEMEDGTKMSQNNTIMGNIIAQMLTGETYAYMKRHDMQCMVLLSANIKGADVHNGKLSDQYLGRWNS